MKINCLCGEEINNETEFFHHVKDKHGYYSINMLYNLLVEIYEKIEALKDSTDMTSLTLLYELKSLVENDKK